MTRARFARHGERRRVSGMIVCAGVAPAFLFLITMRGDRVTVVLNGETVIERAQLLSGAPARGRMGLPDHGDSVRFLKQFMKPID